ncbi:MAG: redoxin domain-containing protein [Bacteroidota bacterium]|jgi:thiol-disulfide isomerase/thioredoxin
MRKLFLTLPAIIILMQSSVSAAEKQKQGDKIVVDTITREMLTKIIKERKGKPLFLNFWATWCVPCREEFPAINKLAEELKDVDFIGISVDFPEEVESHIIPFLKSQKAKFVSYVNGIESDEELINLLDKNWNGALPATFIYDKNGKKISFLEGKKTYEDFKKELEKAKRK